MVNSGSFDTDPDRNGKGEFTQSGHVVQSPHFVSSLFDISGNLCENDFGTQTADSFLASPAIEPTATKTQDTCNMSASFRQYADECKSTPYVRLLAEKSIHAITTKNDNEKWNLSNKEEDKIVSVCCSVPLEKVRDVLRSYTGVHATDGSVTSGNVRSRKISKKEMCLYCDRSFVTSSLKLRHVNRYHALTQNRRLSARRPSSKSPSACMFCNKLNDVECNLKQLFEHLLKEHSNRYFGCAQCECRFPNSDNFENHCVEIHGKARNVLENDLVSSNKSRIVSIVDNTKTKDVSAMFTTNSLLENSLAEYNRSKQTVKLKNDDGKTSAEEQLKSLPTLSIPLRPLKILPNEKVTFVNDKHFFNNKEKIKANWARELRNKKVTVVSTKLKQCLRITRQRCNTLEHVKNTKRKVKAGETINNSAISSKYIFQNHTYPHFDASFRLKTITDHSIDNIKINSLTFDDVFDKAFFIRVKCNIQENLLNYLDGKLFKSIESENRILNFQKPKDSQVEENNQYFPSSLTPIAIPILANSQFGDDNVESQTETKPSKKKPSSNDEVHYKYFTRRKYQAILADNKQHRDLSKLDMWTQLMVKNRQQKILCEQKTEKEILEYRKSEEYKAKIQVEELAGILDKRGPLEDLKEEAIRTVALEKLNGKVDANLDTYFDVTMILNNLLDNLFSSDTDNYSNAVGGNDGENFLINARSTLQNTIQPSSILDEEIPNMLNLKRISLTADVTSMPNEEDSVALEMTGEWARSRIYVCGSCGLKIPNLKLLIDHKNMFHEHVWSQHYEFVGNQGELYRHLSIPGLGKIGEIECSGSKVWRRSDARLCSKCNKTFNCLGDLHRHVLECGGDWTWMLARKKYKYRPYGAKGRKKRRGLLKFLHAFRERKVEQVRQKVKSSKKFDGPRQKPSDAETIQRMLANLPPKRATRKLISLKDGFQRAIKIKKSVKSGNANNKMVTKKKKRSNKATKKTLQNQQNFKKSHRLLRSNSNSTIFEDKKTNLRTKKFASKNDRSKNGGGSNNNGFSKLERTRRNSLRGANRKGTAVTETSNDDKLLKLTPTDENDLLENVDTLNGNTRKVRKCVRNKELLITNQAINEHSEIRNKSSQTVKGKKSAIIMENSKLSLHLNKKKSTKAQTSTDKKSVLRVRKSKFRHSRNRVINRQVCTAYRRKKNANTNKAATSQIKPVPIKTRLRKLIQLDGSAQNKSVKRKKNIKKPVRDLETVPEIVLNNFSESITVTKLFLENQREVSQIYKKIYAAEENPKADLPPDVTPSLQKRKTKKQRGLNDCIAMLTNKLQLHTVNSENALSNTVTKEPGNLLSIINDDSVKDNRGRSSEMNVLKEVLSSENESANNTAIDTLNTVNEETQNILKELDIEKALNNLNTNVWDHCDISIPKVCEKERTFYKVDYVDKKIYTPRLNDQKIVQEDVNESKTMKSSDIDSEDDVPLANFVKKYPKHNHSSITIEDQPSIITEKNNSSEETVLNNVLEISKEKTVGRLTNLEVDESEESSSVNLEKPLKEADCEQINTNKLDIIETNVENKIDDLSAILTNVSNTTDCHRTLTENTSSKDGYRMKENFENQLSITEDLRKNQAKFKENSESLLIFNDKCNNNKKAIDVDSSKITRQEELISLEVTSKTNIPIKKSRKRLKTTAMKSRRLKKQPLQSNNIYCDICNRTFARNENLFKHKRTLTHIAKLSELEALQAAEKSKNALVIDIVEESVENPAILPLAKPSPIVIEPSFESSEISTFGLPSPQNGLKLVDLINDVLNKPIENDFTEHNFIVRSDYGMNRCKSLGERKSFDSDKFINCTNSSINLSKDLSSKLVSTADIIVEKQISLLENMIEDNQFNFKTADDIFISSTIPNHHEESYLTQSNSSDFSITSTKQINDITFTHDTNIIANLINKPSLEDDHLIKSQYEEISEDSNSNHFQLVQEQKSRKVLNRDEELFLECCSLLKSSSDASDLSKTHSKSAQFLTNFGLKPLEELDVLPHKQIPKKKDFEYISNNFVLNENFYDLSYSNSNASNINLKSLLDRNDNNQLFSQPPIFEDISTESLSAESLGRCFRTFKTIASDDAILNDKGEVNGNDCSSPSVESAQIPNEQEAVEETPAKKDERDVTTSSLTSFCDSFNSHDKTVPKTVQKHITDYALPDETTGNKKQSNKMLTKGAMKVFEGIKISIPKNELDMKEVLSCSPPSKRLELEAEEEETKRVIKRNRKSLNHSNNKKNGNKLGLKVTKKKTMKGPLKIDSLVMETEKKSYDVYDFEETQDNMDVFSSINNNSNVLPVYQGFRNKISPTDKKELNGGNKEELTSSLSKKIGVCTKAITKKKCMIMGRIFKNALKSKMVDDIKNIPVIENSDIVENFVLNCHELEPIEPMSDKNKKSKLSEEDMNAIFDNLLNEGKQNYKPKEPSVNITESINNNIHNKKCEQSRPKPIRRRRPRGISPESSDEEFSIKKHPKRQANRKSTVKNECVINLEQELKECIGVASRKSQRKCTSGKQNVLVEYWSSDESNFDAKEVSERFTIENDIPKPNVVSSTWENTLDNNWNSKLSELSWNDLEDTSISTNLNNFEINCTEDKETHGEDVSESPALPEVQTVVRKKRTAVDTLYYWSSSSEDELQDKIEIRPVRDDCDEDVRPLQHGWIVGDSPKKLVTMLAQAKGKNLEVKSVKKQCKKRTCN